MNQNNVRAYLKSFDFRRLFREELGWDNYSASLSVAVDSRDYHLQPIAQKRGVVALLCPTDPIPPYALRRKIERQIARAHREHIVVYADGGQTQQIWQWVRQEPGKPLASREHHYSSSQSGDSLIQKLQSIEFSLEEEQGLTLVEVTGRVRAAFDVERATRRFYDQFKRERDEFEKLLQGIPEEGLKPWYVSVMLDRLMFIYFIQRKGFVDGDHDYLRHKLAQSQARGADRYYRDFLCPLFFEGFARPASLRSAATNALLGQVPYLNGGIFQQHDVEQRHGQTIQLPDATFARLFAFFDQYQWHLDDRPLRDDREINPDVLGYIFEKYINQKQMGAYYTKEDITGYISLIIVVFLFDEARRIYPQAFESDQSIWRLLREDPDRYIYPAMRKGVDLALPQHIAAGIQDVSQRTHWNTPAAEAFALPTEIWRETVARRQRYEEVWLKLTSGKVQEINDFITYNLDLRQFAQDVIETCDDPALLRAFWKAINAVSVLDPTAGSGAFLFAALNILEPLYEACLDRMQAFVDELPADAPNEEFSDFRQILAEVERHPNRGYFVYKSIIINNLYGVDIMAEAVEIAKLRLFLKLVAQVERVEQIEPLPDIDFNIRAGNTLVGYASREQVRQGLRNQDVGSGVAQGKMVFEEDAEALQRIELQAEDVDRLFRRFRELQTASDDSNDENFAETKTALRRQLALLESELNGVLAREYGVDPNKPATYQKWLSSHQPFHWFVEFYGIMLSGGFDVIIGNPPWVEYSKVCKDYRILNYETESCGNLYGICTERCINLRSPNGWLSFIVQLPLTSSSRMEPLRELMVTRSWRLFVVPFDDRPGKLFDGLQNCRSVIFFSHGSDTKESGILSTARYQRWYTGARANLLSGIQYVPRKGRIVFPDQFPKLVT